MSEKVTHEHVETVFTKHVEPLLKQLPDTIETRAARRNLDVAADYLHQAIERAPRQD